MAERPRPDTEYFECEFTTKHLLAALEFGKAEWVEGMVSLFRANLPWIRLQSPLEMAFYGWWMVIRDCWATDADLELRPQHEVIANDRKYRLDFVATWRDKELIDAGEKLGLPIPQIAVELDGHEFHERTPEQVTKRNIRDRDLMASGWKVFHFSGSEFNANPQGCVWNFYLEASSHFWQLSKSINERRRSEASTELA